MVLFEQIIAIVVPVYICIAIGFVWAKRDLPFNGDVVRNLVYNVGAPCLILATFAKVDLDAAALGEIAGAALAAYAGFTVIGILALRAARLALPLYLPALIFPLTASMGLPVCLFAFGDEGLALALVFFAVGTIAMFTAGASIAAGLLTLAPLIKMPVTYAFILAAGLEIAQVDLPRWAFNTTSLLGNMVIPIQLIALGLVLARLKITSFGRTAALAVLRLGMGAAIGWAVATAFDLAPLAAAVVILQSAMPVAVSNYLLAQRYDREPEQIAAMVVLSALASFVVIPVLLVALL